MSNVKQLLDLTRNFTPEMVEDYLESDFKFLEEDESRELRHFMRWKKLRECLPNPDLDI